MTNRLSRISIELNDTKDLIRLKAEDTVVELNLFEADAVGKILKTIADRSKTKAELAREAGIAYMIAKHQDD